MSAPRSCATSCARGVPRSRSPALNAQSVCAACDAVPIETEPARIERIGP